MNSREKGKRGERELAAFLRANGFDARRGQQFAGGADSPDIISALLDWLHIEVKRVEKLNLVDACAQAEGDCGGKRWLVIHRRNHAPWLFTGRLEILLDFIRGVLPPAANRNGIDTSPLIPLPVRGGEGDGAHGVRRPTTEISAAACAAATNQNNTEQNGTRVTRPSNERENENPS